MIEFGVLIFGPYLTELNPAPETIDGVRALLFDGADDSLHERHGTIDGLRDFRAVFHVCEVCMRRDGATNIILDHGAERACHVTH